MKRHSIGGFGVYSAVVLIACSPGRKAEDTVQDSAHADAVEAAPAKPAPFDRGPVKIALVQYSGAGDYFELWTKGARQQAEAVGFDMQHYDAKADDDQQVADMKKALESHPSAIIVDHGRSSTMCPLINQATSAKIPVVVYDVEITKCAPDAVETAQNDSDLATLVLTQMAKDVGDRAAVGYVNPFVIAPLERRDVIWKQFVAKHKWKQQFAVGKFSHTVADDNAKLADRALKAHPGVKAIFAPYDELTKGAVKAIEQNQLQAKVAAYGIDISNPDIELMTKKDSPWKATATTDPSAIGAAVVRTMALELAGQLNSKEVVFPGVLITQSFLVEQQIKNMVDLRAKLPELNLTKVASAPWIRSATF
jgi:simple sugar transport system substrate-binding protein